MRHALRSLLAVSATSVCLLAGAGSASAQDAWPVDPGPGSAVRPVDAGPYVLTSDQPEFYNPADQRVRIITPFGHSTRIVCSGFRAFNDCWQADRDGHPHKLKLIFGFNLGSVSAPNVFLYPGMIPGL